MNPRWLSLTALVACGSSPATVDAPPDAATSAWSMGPPLLVPRLESGVTALGQSVVVLGGFDTDQQAGLDVTKRVDIFDTTTQMWSQLPDAPVARHHIQLAAIGTTLYLLGGLDGTEDANNDFPARGDCYALDTQTPGAVWRNLTAMSAGYERGSAAVVVDMPRIYLFGGAATTDAVASNIYYDIVADAWCPGTACAVADQLPDLPAKRSHPAALRRSDGQFDVVGGLSGLASDTAQADVFTLPLDQQTNTGVWSNGTAMPVQRGGCAFGMIQGRMVCAGGEEETSALSYTQAYDPVGDTWMTYENMPLATAGALGAVVGEKLYVPGGARQLIFEPVTTLLIFSPLDTGGL
jgi:N-acetylneuraminic acid mutarotase